MRGKRIVVFITTFLSILCCYYLSFTWMDFKVTERATISATDENGNVDLVKRQQYLDSLSNKCAYKVFNKEFTYNEIKNKTINWGLDLQGGMSVVLELEINDLILHVTKPKFKNIIQKTLDEISQEQRLSLSMFWNNFLATYKANNEENICNCFVSPKELKTEDDVVNFLKTEVNNGIDKVYKIVQLRLDKYGTSQPNIQRLQNIGKIQVEIPGVHNPERVRKLLQDVAQLQFWNLYDDDKLKATIDAINEHLNKSDKEDKVLLDESMVYSSDNVGAIQDIIDDEEVKKIIPKDMILMWGIKPHKDYLHLYAIKSDQFHQSLLDGDVIIDARQTYDEYGKPTVSMQMNTKGTKAWKRITEKNIGKPIAITLDNKVYTVPVVNTVIPNGSSMISGTYTIEEAQDLANVLRAGTLPARIKISEETVVGSTLGKVAQQQGLLSITIGVIFILLFMILYYNKSGIIADIAIIFNLVFIIGIFAQLGAVLTLSGIAGIVLTIAMAIDGNVLINERIKEELRKEVDVSGAVIAGYQRASRSIIDSNITTLITGIVLYYFGQGVVKGFATTLIIGIITSFFTSVYLTRYLFNKKDENYTIHNMRFSFKYSENMLHNTSFNFIKFRPVACTISLLIIASGIGILWKNGVKSGVDFTGGRDYIIKLDKPVNTSDLKSKVSELLDDNVAIKTYGGDNIIKLTTNYKLHSTDEENIIKDDVCNAIKQCLIDDNNMELVSTNKIEATIAHDIKQSSTKSILFALLAIAIYIILRFNKWQFGLAAVIALIHDVLVVFAIFGISSILGYTIEIDQTIVAAILTIVGYSINGTVIIFDRVRENRKKYSDFKMNVNKSINETLSRTMITSFSTIAITLILFVFGGESLKNFSYTLMMGILFGTYSSIFISAPLLTSMIKKDDNDI